MKKNFLKTIGTVLVMGFLLTVFSPMNTYAQKKNHGKKPAKKVKVVTPVKHYNKLPHRGAQVTVLPTKNVLIRHGRYDYHFHNGVFYRPINGSFIVVAPPVGIRVSVLPPNPFHFKYMGLPYFYYYGTFYISHSSGGYEVVEAPIGARIDALPDGYEVFELDGKVYYRLDDTYYKAVIEDNGNVVYEVVRV